MKLSILPELMDLAGTIPCEMCLMKGGYHLDRDGGCRHRPDNDYEVLSRLQRAVDAFHNVYGSK